MGTSVGAYNDQARSYLMYQEHRRRDGINSEVKKDLADHGSAFGTCLRNVGLGATHPAAGAVMGAKGMAENCFDCRGRGKAFHNVHNTKENLDCLGAIVCTAV